MASRIIALHTHHHSSQSHRLDAASGKRNSFIIVAPETPNRKGVRKQNILHDARIHSNYCNWIRGLTDASAHWCAFATFDSSATAGRHCLRSTNLCENVTGDADLIIILPSSVLVVLRAQYAVWWACSTGWRRCRQPHIGRRNAFLVVRFDGWSARVSRECVKICHLVVHTVALDTCGSSSAPNHQQQWCYQYRRLIGLWIEI